MVREFLQIRSRSRGQTKLKLESELGRPGFEEPFDDDDAADEEQAIVDSDLESDDDGDDSEMGEAAFSPTDDED
ncbi:hypothetical protein HAX54_023561 [Datura stramonium]|uniref:Uncharacterized protein n=1 Tax=Datura stramonium TaxID=4076 RepID=A0ABS8UWH4_DATST|nr:hypothetical protein [Datura stramonium]